MLLPSLSGSVLDVGCCFQPAASPRAQPRFSPQTLDFRLWTRRGRKGTAETRGTQPGTTPQTKAGGINLGILEIRGKQTSSPFAFRVFRVFRGLSPSRNSSPPAINSHYCRAEQRREKELSAYLSDSPRLCVKSPPPASKSRYCSVENRARKRVLKLITLQ